MTNRITPEPSRRDKPNRDPNILFIDCPKANTTGRYIVYSPFHMGMEMHWNASLNRTVPCFADHSLCPGGHDPKTVKWRCYVHAHSQTRDEPVFIQLTDRAWRSWLKKLKPGVSLRGMCIDVHRTEKKNGRLWVEVMDYMTDTTGKMPEPLDCKLSCWRLWGFHPDQRQAKAKCSPGPEKHQNGVFLG